MKEQKFKLVEDHAKRVQMMGNGKWIDETDFLQFQDEDTGYPCLIVRSPKSGAFSIYVAVPEGHTLHGQELRLITTLMKDPIKDKLTYSAKNGDEMATLVDETGAYQNYWLIGYSFDGQGNYCPIMHQKLLEVKERLDAEREEKIDMGTIYNPKNYKTLGHAKRSVKSLARKLNKLTIENAGEDWHGPAIEGT